MLLAAMATVRSTRVDGLRVTLSALSIALSIASPRAARAADPPKSAASAAPSASASASAQPSSAPQAPSASPADEAREKRERQARAIELHNEAKALYERGVYRRAIAKLEAALALDPNGKELIYNLALIHEKLAEADVAETYYLRYIEMETEPVARERAEAIVKRLRGAKNNIKADIQERVVKAAAEKKAAKNK